MEALEQALPGGHPWTRARAAGAAAYAALTVPLFASAMFLSGFLLFMVEPMAARMVLPILGGVPMVWNGCVVFFQIVMLAGYGYAFGASRWLRPRQHVVLHAAVLAAPVFVLPFMIQAGSARPPDGNPLGWLLVLLTGTIGVPFFVLSTSASVLQHWLSRTDHPAAKDPYFLYSASNLGCLLALASYPTIVEPMLTLRDQSRLWTIGYAAFVVVAAGCAAIAWRRSADGRPAGHAVATAATRVTALRRVRWVALAFIPSSLMLAVTSYVSTDIAAVPLLWIVPLALYLLTFALAFGRHATAAGALASRALPLLVVPLALLMILKLRTPLTLVLSLHLAAFAVMALHCHADLAKDRPETSRLTEFYFWLSLGGMLGGLFNTLAAPILFDGIVEYPLVVLLACVLFQTSHIPAGPRRVIASLASAAAMIATGLAFTNVSERVLYATRTFFGVYRVSEDLGGRYHGLAHGTTLHGMQALTPERRHEALTYFHETGPFGQAWSALFGRRNPGEGGPRASDGHEIAVVGLGVGTLATYARPGQHWTFFEIDPAIERIARTPEYFSFMEVCGDRCSVVIGDARVSLGRVPERTYDLLVLDAFSSDSIPIHLMTREALGLYLSRLTPEGLLIMHISNRHLRLAPIVARLAESQGLVAVQQVDLMKPGWPEGKNPSHWIVIARDRAGLGPLGQDSRWSPLVASPSTPLWTDDFSNILSVLSVR